MEALRDDQKCAIELCIAKANEETPKILVKQAQKEAAESESAERRRKAALDIADQIDFGGQVRPE
jgi:F420-0:gamma-glutamyl ligase